MVGVLVLAFFELLSVELLLVSVPFGPEEKFTPTEIIMHSNAIKRKSHFFFEFLIIISLCIFIYDLRSLHGLTYLSISLKVSSGIFMNWEILYFIFSSDFLCGLEQTKWQQ